LSSVRVFYPPFDRTRLIEELERKVGLLRDDAYALVKRSVDIPHLEPHVYCEVDCEVMAGTLGRMIRDGIVIASGS